MKQKRKDRSPPVIGKIDDMLPKDWDALGPERFMDFYYGAGAWVRDRFSDEFLAIDPTWTGNGRAFVVMGRDFRRDTVVIMPNEIN